MGNVHKREMLGAGKQSDKPEERRSSACARVRHSHHILRDNTFAPPSDNMAIMV